MLRQNINLYTPFKVFSPKLKYLNWRQLIVGSLAILLLLVLSFIIEVGDYLYEIYNAHNLDKRISILEKNVNVKKEHYPAFFFSENVTDVITNLRKDVELETDLLEKMSNRVSFSHTLTSLAQIDAPNGWLSEISLQDGGNTIQLTGSDTSMEDLKLYFNNIEKNDFFYKDHLTVNKITHSPRENYPDFQIFTVTITKQIHEKHP